MIPYNDRMGDMTYHIFPTSVKVAPNLFELIVIIYACLNYSMLIFLMIYMCQTWANKMFNK